MESEYDLHIRTAAGESAAHLSLHHDRHCCAHGIWKDYGDKLYLAERAKAEALHIIRISALQSVIPSFPSCMKTISWESRPTTGLSKR